MSTSDGDRDPGSGHAGYDRYPAVYIAETLLERTGRLIASFAETRPSEGVVYWFGLEAGPRAVVTTLVVPDADTSTGAIRTSVAANAEVLAAIAGTPLVLLGQAHSHPAAGVHHSHTDDEETFARFDGAISVVIPYFARYGVELEHCGVHRHLGGRFRVIPTSAVSEHLVVVPGVADFRRDVATRATSRWP